MESKKDIGKLFRENLEPLDFSPSTKVWEQIELDLGKKKKKRRFILWFFFVGSLVIGLGGGLIYTFSEDGSFLKDNENKILLDKKVNNNNVNSISEQNSSDRDTNEKSSTASVDDEAFKESAGDKNTPHKNSGNRNETYKNKLQKNRPYSQQLNSKNKTISEKKRKAKKKTGTLKNNSFSKSLQNLAIASSETPNSESTDLIVQTNTTKNTIGENTEKTTTVDSLVVAADTKIAITEKDSLAVKDSVADVKEKSKGYEIVVAPYYGLNYGSYFGEFDAISNNAILEQKAAMKDTYGVLVRWMFGGKWGVQTGFGKINSQYFSTIEKTGSTFINTQNVTTDVPVAELNGIFANETKVKFTYDSSYLEVPLEAYYVVRDKKFGVATSFGFGFLFGSKNTVFAESENIQKMKIGRLTTNAPISGTLNGKVYLFYKITPSLHLDLYPTFQYQIMGNTDSSNYSGYFFSIRTGLSYKF